MTVPRPLSMRMAATAGSLVLAISAIAAPAVLAQDDTPEATINSFAATIEAKDFEAVPAYFCPEFAGSMGAFDMSSLIGDMPAGMDAQTLLDVITLDVAIDPVDVVTESDTEAVVNMTGSISVGINAEALPPFIEALLTSMGEEVTPDMVQMFSSMMESQFEVQATDISTELTLVRGEDGGWQICSDLTGSGTSEASPEASAGA